MATERDLPRSPGERAAPASPTYPAYPPYPASRAGPAPRAAKPPLTKRLRAGHWVAIDCAVASFAALCDLAVLRNGLIIASRAWFPAALLLAVAIAAPMALRRRAPVPAFGALLILAVLLSHLTPALPQVTFLAAAYVLYTVTVVSSKRSGAAALGVVLATMLLVATAGGRHVPDADQGVLIPVALATVIAWMTGYSARQRRLYVAGLQYQAASSAVAEERLRIARELHDVVAHSMSVIAVQAGYGQYVIDTSPDGAREALGAIQATSRDALEEMRRMLGVLRQRDAAPAPPPAGGFLAADDPAAPLAPAPGLADLDRLITRTGGAGIRVSLEVSGPTRPVPAGIDLSAYRIIQEALTNVVKHSGGSAHCTVSLGYGADALDVRVIDDGGLALVPGPPGVRAGPYAPGVGAGHGIIGMRERVNLCGGRFSAGPLAAGGFLVAATLPLSPAPGQNGPGQNGPGQNGPGPSGPGPSGPGQNAPGQNAPGQNAPGQDAPGQDAPA